MQGITNHPNYPQSSVSDQFSNLIGQKSLIHFLSTLLPFFYLVIPIETVNPRAFHTFHTNRLKPDETFFTFLET